MPSRNRPRRTPIHFRLTPERPAQRYKLHSGGMQPSLASKLSWRLLDFAAHSGEKLSGNLLSGEAAINRSNKYDLDLLRLQTYALHQPERGGALKMKVCLSFCFVLIWSGYAFPRPVAAQTRAIPQPGRDAFEQTCARCHATTSEDNIPDEKSLMTLGPEAHLCRRDHRHHGGSCGKPHG